jgi:hypothetical protein
MFIIGEKKMATTVVKSSKCAQRKESLTAALKSLGVNKNRVAAYLTSKNIQGDKSESESCPVANFLYKKFPKATSVDVDSESIEVRWRDCDVSIKPPKAVASFIEDFDNGKFPDLDAANNETEE